MPRQIRVEGRLLVVPDDATPEEIDEILNGPTGPAPMSDGGPREPSAAPAASGVSDEAWGAMPPGEKMRNVLQWAGKAVGGAFMGPGASGAVDHPKTFMATAAMPIAAAPARGVLQGVARRLYGGLLKPKQGLKDSFGDAKELAGTLLDERVPISRGGLEKITGRLGESRNTAMQMVRDAEAAGAQGVIAKDVLGEFRPVVAELRKRADIGQANQLPQVGARGRAILRTAGGRGGDIPLTRAQELKETAQAASSGAYRMMDRGVQKQLSADDLLDTAVARGFKGGIERKVPGVGEQNARTQKLLGGTRALEDALEREANNNMFGGGRDWAALGAAGLGAAGGGPGGAAISGAMMRLLATPSTGSRIAIGVNEASRLPLEPALRQALLALLSQRDQE